MGQSELTLTSEEFEQLKRAIEESASKWVEAEKTVKNLTRGQNHQVGFRTGATTNGFRKPAEAEPWYLRLL